ncbi:MAG TPA: hypothetical protein VNJ53_10055 [Gaiellaceae bacterium]|nr:hypothetical protein [Gaiellaceae bacterium]
MRLLDAHRRRRARAATYETGVHPGVDEYLASMDNSFLVRIDDTGRLAIKPG